MTTMQQQIAADVAERQAKRGKSLIQPENRLDYMHGRVEVIKSMRKRKRDHWLNWQESMIIDKGTEDLA